MMTEPLYLLKTTLQNHGALRPEAWEAILLAMQHTTLKVDESLIRKAGTLAYIAQGLLKEYDAQNRKKPAIVNFISEGESLITRKHNQNHYLKAIIPTQVYYWDLDDLQMLYAAFNELKTIYDSLCENYDREIGFRHLVLESNDSTTKIKLFLSNYHDILPLLKKKDIANYINLSYNHFIHAYNNLL